MDCVQTVKPTGVNMPPENIFSVEAFYCYTLFKRRRLRLTRILLLRTSWRHKHWKKTQVVTKSCIKHFCTNSL